ncbi:MAG: hypothetical protein H0U53_01390 [Actinobacteria bacterium]|nr:hypothetical protein [Actinomycetota bacterium]
MTHPAGVANTPALVVDETLIVKRVVDGQCRHPDAAGTVLVETATNPRYCDRPAPPPGSTWTLPRLTQCGAAGCSPTISTVELDGVPLRNVAPTDK